MENTAHIVKAARAFGLIDVKNIETLVDGLMHKTYKLESMAGIFILQQLHPLLSPVEVVRDFMHVTEHLRLNWVYAPICLRTARGDVMYRDGDRAYRVCTFIPGQTIQVAATTDIVREAGAIVGRFHKAMLDYDRPFESHFKLHETPKIVEKLAATLRDYDKDACVEAREMGEFLVATIPTLYLPELPQRASHGDLKITNILFDTEGKAMSLIDFDTCNLMSVSVEMGDAFRSWCGQAEDDPQNSFSLEKFRAGWEGYYAETHKFIEPSEQAHIVQGILLITLELAARFLTDYFEDSYFGWDEKRYASRAEHNLARAKGQLALYNDLLVKRHKAEKVITEAAAITV